MGPNAFMNRDTRSIQWNTIRATTNKEHLFHVCEPSHVVRARLVAGRNLPLTVPWAV
jgi:hypothetical protein